MVDACDWSFAFVGMIPFVCVGLAFMPEDWKVGFYQSVLTLGVVRCSSVQTWRGVRYGGSICYLQRKTFRISSIAVDEFHLDPPWV